MEAGITMRCRKCGYENPQDKKFCTQCGTPLSPAPEAGPGRTSLYARLIPFMGLDQFASLNRWIVFGALGLTALLGLYPSHLGHIDTTPFIYQLMPIISCINPALGLLCAIVFGVTDMTEKMITNNIYGSTGLGNYIGARVGYLIAYSAVIVAGVLPGVLSRVFRNAARRMTAGRAARTADGGQLAGTSTSFVEIAASALGGAIGAMGANIAAIGLELPAFLLRPNPDYSCYSMAIGNLIGGIPPSGLAGALGGAAGTYITKPTGKAKPEERPARAPVKGKPAGLGGPAGNPYTHFQGGNGPGQCELQGLPNYWVNTATLNLVIQDVILAYQGLGPKIKLQLTYNSGQGESGMFGADWAFSYVSTIDRTAGSIMLLKDSGQALYYRPGPPISSQRPGAPIEAIPTGGESDRLFDHGQYWLLMEKNTGLKYRYDKSPGTSVSRLTTISDLNGNSVRISYDGDGTITAITDAAGRLIRFSYDGKKRCTAFTAPNGRTARFVYDDRGDLIKVVDLQGIASNFQYDTDHYLTRMDVGGKNRTTAFNYRASGQGKHLVGVTDARGNTTRYEMAMVSPRQVRAIDPAGKMTLYESTTEGFTAKITDPMDKSMQYSYDRGLRVSTRDKNGNITRLEHDIRGNLIKATNPAGNSWEYTYDVNDNLISLTSPIGDTTRYTYDGQHQLVGLRSPMGNTSTFNYDPKGQLTSMTDPNGHKTGFEYDGFGNLTAVISPLGDITRISYDEHGLAMAGITDARGNKTGYQFDGNNRLTMVNHPDGAVKTHVYDCCAGIATIDENGNKAEFIRSPLMDIEQLVDPMRGHTRYDYDACGRLVSVVDALNRRRALAYDGAGNIIQATDPAGQSLRMSYDPEGNLLSLSDERGKSTRLAYDACNRRTRLTDPIGRVNSIARDALGRIEGMINARSGKISLAYDADARIKSISHDGVAVATFTYDASGNLMSTRDLTGETTYTYDAADRVTSIRYPGGLVLSFSYDAAGNVRTIAYPDGLVLAYDYDARNRVAGITWGKNSISFRYDAVGNLIGESRSNDTQSTYRYDANDHLSEIVHMSGPEKFIRITYDRDAVGNITNESALLPVASLPEPMSVASTYNDAGQIVSRGPDVFAYDADGNLSAISGGKWQAVYDVANRPVEVLRNGHKSLYAYNGLGQRVRVTGGASTRNHYCDRAGRIMFEADEEGRIIAWYVYRGEALAARIKPAQESYFYHYDKTGNTLALTGTDGRVHAAYAYGPFGDVVARSEPGDDNPFTYVGEYGVMDEGDGLFFMKNRYFDAYTGRFLQKDPIGFIGGANPYAYAGNNPVDHIDPEGLQDPITIGLGVLLAGYVAYLVGENLLPFRPINETLAAKADNPAAPLPQLPSPGQTVKSLAQVPETLAIGAGPAVLQGLTNVTIARCGAPGTLHGSVPPNPHDVVVKTTHKVGEEIIEKGAMLWHGKDIIEHKIGHGEH